MILLVLTLFCTITSAVTVDVEAIANRSPEYRKLARKAQILTAPIETLEEREEAESAVGAISRTVANLISRTTSTSALPSAFDSGLGTNFTTATATSCPSFIDKFLANSTFKSCEPISLLLQNSASFFEAETSPLLLSLTLDTACGASTEVCAPLMKSLAAELIEDSNCGQDYRNENPLVLQAYAGLVAYVPLYQATCIKNSETGNYCFADAVTNTTNPSDTYPYYIALGIDLPAGAAPTCSTCLKETMAVFADAAANASQPVSSTYLSAAQLIDVNCGPSFVNSTVPVAVITSGTHKLSTSTSYLLPVAAVIGFLLFI